MNMEKYKQELIEVIENHETEQAHMEADAILVKVLRELGQNEIADIFDKASDNFWYA